VSVVRPLVLTSRWPPGVPSARIMCALRTVADDIRHAGFNSASHDAAPDHTQTVALAKHPG